MAILDYIATARDDTFSARVSFILMKSAVNIANEDPSTANHANRIAFADKHFKALINCKALAAAAIATNPTLQTEIDSQAGSLGSTIPDSDLEFVINGLIDNFANAYAAA